jgi:hypothetical protein
MQNMTYIVWKVIKSIHVVDFYTMLNPRDVKTNLHVLYTYKSSKSTLPRHIYEFKLKKTSCM